MKTVIIKGVKKITLTIKEADEIKCLLESLESMGGTYDDEFTKECNRAGILAKHLDKIIYCDLT